MRERIVTFDIMKGIAILLVIVGHSALPYYPVPQWIYAFHMPLFFLLAGYFHKDTTDYVTLVKKSAHRLLLPYFFTAFIVLLYEILSAVRNGNPKIVTDHLWAIIFASGAHHHSRFLADMPNIGPTWFLFALFWCKNVSNFLLSNKIPIIFIILIALSATALDYYIINLPFALLPGLSAMIFFLIGYICHKHRIPWWCITICIICYPFAAEHAKAFMGTCEYKYIVLSVLGACGGTLGVYYISKALEKSAITSNSVSWIGKNSLAILCVHVIEMNCHLSEHFAILDPWYLQIPTEIAFAIVCTWICSKISITRKVFGIT